MIGDVVGGHDLFFVGAGLAMDADAHFHFVLADFKAGFASSRNGAGGQICTHGAHIVDNLLGNGVNFFQSCPLLCLGTGNLMYKNRACHTPASGGVQRVLNGHVIIGDHAHALDAVHFGHFCGHFKIHYITSIVLDDQQNTGGGSHFPNGSFYLVGGGGGKDRACHRCIQHALAYEAAMGGFVAGTAAGNQCNLICFFLRTDQNVVVRQFFQVLRMGLCNALEHFQFYIFDLIDQFFHCR